MLPSFHGCIFLVCVLWFVVADRSAQVARICFVTLSLPIRQSGAWASQLGAHRSEPQQHEANESRLAANPLATRSSGESDIRITTVTAHRCAPLGQSTVTVGERVSEAQWLTESRRSLRLRRSALSPVTWDERRRGP